MLRLTGVARRGAIAAALLAVPVAAQPQAVTPPPVVATVPATDLPRPAAPAARPVRHHSRGDPLEGANRAFYAVHLFLDRILFRPAAMVYKTIVPKFLRKGIRHVISNITEPVVFVNDVLQLKPKRAVRTFARFAINSTLGIGGVLDIAKAARLPHHDNGFGDTLGRYGVGPGPYLFLPLIGPTDLRDLLGGQADGAVLPIAVGYPFDSSDYGIPHAVVGGLDLRVEADADLKALLGSAADPYATLRSVYLQSRAAEIDGIRHGAPAAAPDDPLVDPEAPAGAPATPTGPATPDAFDSTPADPEAPSAPPAPPGAAPDGKTPTAPATPVPASATPS